MTDEQYKHRNLGRRPEDYFLQNLQRSIDEMNRTDAIRRYAPLSELNKEEGEC